MSNHSGAEWIRSALKIEEMSPLGETVADLLGDVFYGIYHLEIRYLRRADWGNPFWIEYTYHGPLSTFDNDVLTRLIVLCHGRLPPMGICI